MKYPVAERFVAPQGEGLYTGAVMAFIRLTGCSVGQGVCTACDTDFDMMRVDLGGGLFSDEELQAWVRETGAQHVCLTGGEPLDRDIRPLLFRLTGGPVMCHVETSGTKRPAWLDLTPFTRQRGHHAVQHADGGWQVLPLWVTVSPKPGYLREMVEGVADEIKYIHGGLGDGPGWPALPDALRWADQAAKLVYLQPRNDRLTINGDHMADAIRAVTENPSLRLSMQAHKYIRTR